MAAVVLAAGSSTRMGRNKLLLDLGGETMVRRGVRHVAATADAIVVVLADMPFVTADMIATLVARYRETAAPLVASHYGGVQAPPTLYDRALFAELLSIPGERCAKQVVRRHEQEAALVAWPETALRDIDVPADCEGIRADLTKG